MKPQNTYNLSVLNSFKDVVTKKLDERKDETSLDVILSKAKKDAMELVKLGFTPLQLKQAFQEADIDVSLHKVKQIFFTTRSKSTSRKPRISTESNLAIEIKSGGELQTISQLESN
ncbi:MAG: hypothetical protein K2Y14_09580 [Burkholderiales bacterium]|nr:hypothetical protein [Burkholderiales bacterium]